MKHPTREYVVMCENVTGDVWTPERMWLQGADETQVIRCRECVNYITDTVPGCSLLDFGTVNMEDGFCSWALPKDGDEH